jgi:UDP-2,3-diacylglucosamine pyrophosphatase LpxH
MSAIIVSDLHIGSKYFLYHRFDRFLENMPAGHELILNGDVVDNPYKRFETKDLKMLEKIRKHSSQRKVVWVRGNHDNSFTIGEPGDIQFVRHYSLGSELLLAHGDSFDEIMPKNMAFIRLFKLMHDLRVKLGARPVHVAHYAKKWSRSYRILRENVMMNAVKCARENGYMAVTCGHTHYPEDRMVDGIRYINTGSWTERQTFYLFKDGKQMSLNPAPES